MNLLQRNDLYFTATLILLSLQTTSLYATDPTGTICPIGYRVAYAKYSDKDPICYRQKGPEPFADKFKDCNGNLFTLDLYNNLNITKPELVLWTDYKASHPGGPFVDWSYTVSTGTLLPPTDEVNYDASSGYDELCVVTHPETKLTAKSCTEKYYRYCFVEPYKEEPSTEGCESLDQSLRFWSPRSTCLRLFTGNRTDLRANWYQSQDICVKNGGSLLYEGWRYSNNLLLLNGTTASSKDFPLALLLNSTGNMQRIDSENNFVAISSSEWDIINPYVSAEFLYGSVREDLLYYEKGDKLFNRVICERPVELKTLTFNISLMGDRKIALTANYILEKAHILCFTDSINFHVTKWSSALSKKKDYFEVKTALNGYYWCIHNDTQHYYPSESEKLLYIKRNDLNTDKLINLYAVQIRTEPYELKTLKDKTDGWRTKFEEYVFYMSKYGEFYGDPLNSTRIPEEALRVFKNTHITFKYPEKSIVKSFTIKQVYLNATTILAHVVLNNKVEPVLPGTWEGLEVIAMRPAYYCSELKKLGKPHQPLGTTVKDGCITYKCVGDFNTGVQWIETAEECTTTSIITFLRVTDSIPTAKPLQIRTNISDISDESGENSEDEESTTVYSQENTTMTSETVTIVHPPTDKPTKPPTRPPIEIPTVVPTTEIPTTTDIPTTTVQPDIPLEEQLQQAINSLETLVNNTDTIMVNDIEGPFTKVNDILTADDDTLHIPGQLLHLLDDLGARINLNGSQQNMAVRENIALLVADAGPNFPVRGFKIATTGSEVFKEGAFEIMNDEVNDTHLMTGGSELVVQLPQSVTDTARRISFVVFRNDRAFHSNHGLFMVNSRVLSVNIENLTKFDQGEVIDIHLSPNRGIPELNESRACAFWEFFGNETGQWSQEGCRFIPASKPGLLDTCRCNHLTHFAEILVPSNFSQKHKDILEIITIIGCILSILGLIIVGITAALFRSWRRDFSNKIWLQLCIAIFLLSLCFLIVVFAKFNKYDIICMLLGVVLHYSVLASFCWMLVAAVLSYRRLVLVFTRDASHKLLRASAFAWGVPCAIVGILLSAAPHSYEGHFDDKTPSASFCYPTGLAMWLAIYAPIAIMLLANWTLFVLIVRSVFASTRIQRHGDSNEALRCASVSCLLVFLFGLPWIFGLFAYNIVAAYFFTLTATFQGFVLFVFFVVGNKKTRDLWLNKLKIKQTRKVPVTSSTYTNRSTGGGPLRPAGPASMEVKFSKPRSLESPDDSRFS